MREVRRLGRGPGPHVTAAGDDRPALGVLGGSFNPPHVGHLVVASDACAQLGLERVLFVPAAAPPHKHVADGVPADVRLEMTRRAVAGDARFAVSTVEIDERLRYTVDTVKALQAAYPGHRLDFIIGSDSLLQFATWHRPQSHSRRLPAGGGVPSRRRPRGRRRGPGRVGKRTRRAPRQRRHRRLLEPAARARAPGGADTLPRPAGGRRDDRAVWGCTRRRDARATPRRSSRDGCRRACWPTRGASPTRPPSSPRPGAPTQRRRVSPASCTTTVAISRPRRPSLRRRRPGSRSALSSEPGRDSSCTRRSPLRSLRSAA